MDSLSGSVDYIINTVIFSLALLLVFLVSGLVLKFLISNLLFEKAVQRGLKEKDKNSILHIKIPATNEKAVETMEEFLRTWHKILSRHATISLELASRNQFLSFYIVIPKEYKKVTESQIFAYYPDAEIDEVNDYLPEFTNDTQIVELNFSKSSIYPLATYNELDGDVLKNLASLLSKTTSDEEVYIQFVLKKAGSRFWQRMTPMVVFFNLFGQKYSSEQEPTLAFSKMSHELFRGKLRIAYVGKDKNIAQKNLDTFLSLFKQVDGVNKLRRKKFNFLVNFSADAFGARVFDNGDFWSLAELATIYHFVPYKGTMTASVVHTTSKRAPAPDILPREGLVNEKEVSFFGETTYHNEIRKFGIKRVDRRKHLYVVGKTGSGKSKLLELLIRSDILDGYGCCFLDPHGDSANEILKFVPKDRIEDVVYINPTDRDFPIGFNPLEPVGDYETRHRLSDFFISIFRKLFEATWNPRMEHLIRYITLALLETSDSSVLGIARILSDTNFRQRVIKQIQDPVVKGFWTNEFASWNERFANDAVVPILNKVGQFISNPIMRNMVGQTRNVLDFEKFMNDGKIVIISIPKGILGEENIQLLGSMFITKIQQAALARARMREDERKDFYLYIDEFQNFATDAFSSILSEARKYHLDLTIAHQYIAQLPDDVKATAFGNVGSLIVFAVGGDDAAYLTRELLPVFQSEDLINLNAREMYVKMSIDGKLTPPFSAKTIDLPKPQFDYSVEIANHSRMKYGRNRVEVEREIEKWTQGTESASVKDENSFPEPLVD